MFARAAGGDSRRIRTALLQKLSGGDDMFALGTSVARVVQMASSDDQGTHDLAYYVLSDVALTQRILRLSNTAIYRTAAGTTVTTISRAISLLGFDNVKTTALALLLVDALSNSAHAHSVRIELEHALCASLVGREMARFSPYQGAEEAAIAALFKNLGPLLVATHEHERYCEVAALQDCGKHTLGQASQMILGCSYDALAEAVMAEWKIPEQIGRALATLPPGVQKVPASRAEWMKQVASFSAEVAQLLSRNSNPAGTVEARALLGRYGAALGIDAERMEAMFEAVQKEMASLLQSLSIEAGPKTQQVVSPGGLPNVLLLSTLDAGDMAADMFYPSGKPYKAREQLLAGVQDVTQMRAGAAVTVNDVILTVLETLYRSMGFRFATVCLQDLRSGQYRARVAFGDNKQALQAGFNFPLSGPRDLFYLAMENDADLMIADAFSPQIRALLPPWHRQLFPDARSFIVLPLVLGKVQLGLFYADRIEPAPEGVPPDETSLIKALKQQVLNALAP